MRRLFSFPNPVNDASARVVAAGMMRCVTAVVLDPSWLTGKIAYGVAARMLTGPPLSPIGLPDNTRVITPTLRLPARLVPGPPKRFAQDIGALLSVNAPTNRQKVIYSYPFGGREKQS